MREIEVDKTCNYIHLFSGGLDSAYSLLKLAKELIQNQKPDSIQPIFFDYGHYAAKIEWKKVNELVKYIRAFLNNELIISDPIMISLKSDLFTWTKSDAFKGREGEKNPEIENRNMVLFSVLASYLIACANRNKISSTTFEISSGFKNNELPDSNEEFFTGFKEIISNYLLKRDEPKNIKFKFNIFPAMERQEVIDEIKKLLDDDENKLNSFRELTISCYSPTSKEEPCHECSKCKNLRNEKIRSPRTQIELRFSA